MKKVLILTGKSRALSQSLHPILERIAELYPGNKLKFITSSLEDLAFYIDGDHTSVRDNTQDFDVASFDLVVFRTIGSLKEEAMATALYLKQKGAKFIDAAYPRVSGRLGSTIKRWAAGLSIPRTAYGTAKNLISSLENIGTPAVLKATNSRKGRDNYLIETRAELADILEANPKTRFVLQQFIPNRGDYRVLIIGYDQAIISHRLGNGDTHLNNVSAGGTETLIDDHTGLEPVIDLARNAAKLDKLSLAGVDIIVDKYTRQPYILEVNRAPQLTLDSEIGGFYQLIRSELA